MTKLPRTNRIKKLRFEAYLRSPTALAKLVGVTRQAVYGWENNLSHPGVKNELKLVKIFNLKSVLELYEPRINPDTHVQKSQPLDEKQATELAHQKMEESQPNNSIPR